MKSRERFIRACGWTMLLGSVLGASCAMIIIGWPREVSKEQYSYPFGPTSFVVSQVFFSIRHLAETAGLVGLVALLWKQTGLSTRAGLLLGMLGSLLFVGMELVTISAAHVTNDSPTAANVNAGYSAPTLTFGVGLVLAGIGLARSKALPGTLGRWIVLLGGLYVFVPLLPALFVPSMVLGRIVIGVWMLLLGGIGLAMLRAVPVTTGSQQAVPT